MKTIVLQQFFYGRDVLRDYGMLASSVDDVELVNGVRDTCEAYQSPLAGGLPAPVLMTRVTGRYVLFDCIRNGPKDPAGRGTIFHHVLAAGADALQETGIDAFELFSTGHFSERLPEKVGRIQPLAVGVKTSKGTPGMDIKFPAAVETDASDIELFRSILGDRSNSMSWATFASRDMPGFELVGVRASTRTSARRWRYDSKLNVLVHPTLDSDPPCPRAPAGVRVPSEPDCASEPMQHPKVTCEKAGSSLLRISIVANIILAVALILNLSHTRSERAQNEHQPSSNNLQEDSSASRQITIEELRDQFAQKFDECYPDGRLSHEEVQSLTKESGLFFDYTEEGWSRKSGAIWQNAHAAERPIVLKVLKYVEFMNNDVLRTNSENKKRRQSNE